MPKLGVNVDHVATLREARKGVEPDPVEAAAICERAGCDSIVVHLREDRRHIKDKDLRILRRTVKTRLNLEMSTAREIVRIALRVKPNQITLVPERRQELTTEGGLDVIANFKKVKRALDAAKDVGISTSIFVDPEKDQVRASKDVGAEFIELHTGVYTLAEKKERVRKELRKLKDAARFAKSIGLAVNAGHGLNYQNVKPVARIPEVEELNIGHSIISRAVLVGLERAVKEMLRLIRTR